MAKKASKEATIIEEKQEFMVDHTTSKKRISHFLKPTLNPTALPPKLPKIQSFSISSKPNVLFHYNSTPLKGWKTWVENLEETHEPAWRKAGIFDAIKCSTYHIPKVSDLILTLVQKWCPETNTFVFPWGEATVTLEDVYILGGFSPLGDSVFISSSNLGKNVEQIENKLIKSYRKLTKTNTNLSHLRWQEHFMGCGNKIEHAAFLALWLVRHVFPSKNTSLVTQTVFSMAARISCGAKLAFGPAILASIYRELTLLKREIVDFVSGGSLLKVSSPLQLVQVWAWERFPSLGPVPRIICCGETRLARWECRGRKLCNGISDVKMCLDSARESFRWRPYSLSIENWSLPRFYVDSGTWVVVNSDEDWKLFARCLMVGQLDGLDFVEGYNPHRVALQFGFDQDIPGSIDRSRASSTLDCMKLYLPPRMHGGDVTDRYFDWWKTTVNVGEETRVGCKRKKKIKKRTKKMAKICCRSNEHEAIDVTENVRRNPVENLLQFSNDFDMSCVLRMESWLNSQENTSMLEDKEIEVRTENHSVGEGSNDSDGGNFHGEEMENEINISCSKLAEIEPNRSVDQEEGHMNLSEMPIEMQPSYDAMNSLCLQVAAENQNLGKEVAQVNVTSLLIVPEGGGSGNMNLSEMVLETRLSYDAMNSLYLQVAAENQNLRKEVGQVNFTSLSIVPEGGRSGKGEDNAMEQNNEQNLIQRNVKMEKSLECLEADIPQLKTPTETKETLIRVACKNEPDRAICQGPDPDTNNGSIVPVNGEVIVIDDEDDCDHNTFTALCLNYESRISRLEKEIFAVLASNLTRLTATG